MRRLLSYLKGLSCNRIEALVRPQARSKAALRNGCYKEQALHAPLGQLGSLHRPGKLLRQVMFLSLRRS